MTSKLTLYQGAVALMGDRPLVALTDNRESRRALDGAWDRGAINFCLKRGLWNFATRTSKIDYDTDFAPIFGYRKVFPLPSDFMRIVGLSADEYCTQPLNDYKTEGGKIFADVDSIYLNYVSNHADYGGDYSLWPEPFTRYVEAYLAVEASSRLTRGSRKREELFAIADDRLKNARSIDAADQAAAFPPRGSWSRSRSGSRTTGERRGD